MSQVLKKNLGKIIIGSFTQRPESFLRETDASVLRKNALGIAFILCCTLIYGIKLLPSQYTGNAYILIHVLLSVIMFMVWRNRTYSLSTLLWVGFLARLVLLPAGPLTSNDVERYLWDGAVTLAGYDSYVVSPNLLAETPLRALWPTPEEHAQYATLYPPGALLLFTISALAGPVYGFWGWKILVVSAGIISLVLMGKLTQRTNSERHFALFALSPLLILETNIGLHLDSFSVLAIIISLLFLVQKNHIFAGIFIGWGASIKFLPLILIGPLFFILTIKNSLKLWSGAIAALLILYGGAFLIGLTPIGVIQVFFEKWRYGSPIFSLLENTMPSPYIPYCLAILALILFGIAALMAHKGKSYGALSLAIATPLLLSPVVFPWYLIALIPLFTIKPSVTIGLWVSVAPFSYIVLNRWVSEGIWEVSTWPIIAIGIALSIGLCLDLYRSKNQISSTPNCSNKALS